MQARFFDANNLVRLHVIAHDDTEWAQAMKMYVVKAIRREAKKIAMSANDASDAFSRFASAHSRLKRCAKRTLRIRWCLQPVEVQTGTFHFPDRVYGEEIVPEGDYRAVRVVLGSGTGKNWWCVVYPNLCAVEQACAQALSQPGNVQFYSSIAKYVAQWMRGRIG